MTNNYTPSFISRKAAWVMLLIVALLALAMVLVPVWVIQPFKAQSVRGLEISYAMRRWSPQATMMALIVALLLIVWLWRGARRWWKKIALVLILLPMLASTWFARQNHFEWMFNPLAHAGYVSANAATFVADSDLVMAVARNGEAAAYPIRQLAYHHLVQDTVGGVPIVVTY